MPRLNFHQTGILQSFVYYGFFSYNWHLYFLCYIPTMRNFIKKFFGRFCFTFTFRKNQFEFFILYFISFQHIAFITALPGSLVTLYIVLCQYLHLRICHHVNLVLHQLCSKEIRFFDISICFQRYDSILSSLDLFEKKMPFLFFIVFIRNIFGIFNAILILTKGNVFVAMSTQSLCRFLMSSPFQQFLVLKPE